MSGQRNRAQSGGKARARRRPGPRGAALHGRSHCVRSGDGFHAHIYLDADKAESVRPGQQAQIRSRDVSNLRVAGQVLAVAPTSPVRYLVTIAVTGSHPGLRHGLPVDVRIITRTRSDVLVVPNTAVIRLGGEFFADVLEPTGQRRRIQFTPGLVGCDTTEVLDGLSEGQQVVLSVEEPDAAER